MSQRENFLNRDRPSKIIVVVSRVQWDRTMDVLHRKGQAIDVEVHRVDSSGRRNTSIRRCMDGMAKRVGECSDREAGDALAGPSSSGAT
jgi:hypothetical protein